MKRLFILFFFLYFQTTLPSQIVNLIGSPVNEHFSEVKAVGNDFYAVGYSDHQVTDEYNGIFVKMDAAGELVWFIEIGATRSKFFDFIPIENTNEFLLVGRTEPLLIGPDWQNNRSIVAKVIDNGTDAFCEWIRYYDMDFAGSESFYKITPSNNPVLPTTYFVSGVINNVLPPSEFDAVVVLNINGDGTENWMKRYVSPLPNSDNEFIKAALPLPGGGLLLAGNHNDSGNIVFLDATGNHSQNPVRYAPERMVIRDVLPVGTDYIMVGSMEIPGSPPTGFISRIDNLGNEIYTAITPSQSELFDLIQIDSNFYALGMATVDNVDRIVLNKFEHPNPLTILLSWTRYLENNATGYLSGFLSNAPGGELFMGDCRIGHPFDFGNFDVLIAKHQPDSMTCISKTFDNEIMQFFLDPAGDSISISDYDYPVPDILDDCNSIGLQWVPLCQSECMASNNGPICQGDTLLLFENDSIAVTWNWVVTTGTATIDNPSLQNPTATGVSNGDVFTVFVTDATGAVDSCTTVAVVFDAPNCSASNNGPICMGDTLQLDETGGDAVAWEWSTSGSATLSATNVQNPTATGVANGEVFTVVITDANGCTSSCSTTAEVFDAPICMATNNGPACLGDTLTLSEIGGDAVAWEWSTDGAATLSATNVQSPTATGAANGETFTVVITDANGCTSSCSTTATIADPPTCLATNDGPICMGDSLSLNESGGDAVAWLWSTNGSATLSADDVQSPTATGVTDGEVFTVVITDANGCTSSCSTTAEVFDLPVCMASNDGPICMGETLTLNESGGDAVAWLWSTNGSATLSATNVQSPTATGVTNGEVFTVIITDANGCTSSCSTTAEVFDLPVCMASNDGPICMGETLTLNESGGDAVTWLWSTNGSATLSATNVQSPTATGVTDGEVFTVVITDINGCTSTCSTTAVVYDNPTVSATNDGPVCEGDPFKLMATPMGGTAPYSYSWSRLSGSKATKQNPRVFDATMADAGDYTVTVTDINGCTATATTTVVIQSNITDAGIIEGDEYFCGAGYDPAPITQISPATGASPIEYFWMKHTASNNYWEVIPGATGTTYDPGVIYETTQYSRCARRAGCVKALESNIVTKTVGMEALTDIDGHTAICVGMAGEYAVPAQAGATYSWDFGYGATPQYANTSTVNVSWNTMGVRTIHVTVTNGTCIASNILPVFVTDSPIYCSACLVATGAGAIATGNPMAVDKEMGQSLNSNLDDLNIAVYPNPFNDRLNVKIIPSKMGAAQYRITDLQGKMLKMGHLQSSQQPTEIDLTTLPPGMYMLTLDVGQQGVFHKKVLKQ